MRGPACLTEVGLREDELGPQHLDGCHQSRMAAATVEDVVTSR
jgi:hypothetical protein